MLEVEEPLEMEGVKGFTCVVDVMDATSDGTLEQQATLSKQVHMRSHDCNYMLDSK